MSKKGSPNNTSDSETSSFRELDTDFVPSSPGSKQGSSSSPKSKQASPSSREESKQASQSSQEESKQASQLDKKIRTIYLKLIKIVT
jgi:hypothetical protein